MPDDNAITLGTEVTLPTAPLSAKAVFIADNEAEIFVNDLLLGTGMYDVILDRDLNVKDVFVEGRRQNPEPRT